MKKIDKSLRIIISCGGTGGHFYPGLTIAKKFKDQGNSTLLLISGNHTESQLHISSKTGIDAVAFKAPQRPKNIFTIYIFLYQFICGFIKAKLVFKNFKPTVFLAMGSFASVPSSLAAFTSKTPIFLHEGNAKIGKANRLLSRFAKLMFLSFPVVNQKKSKTTTEYIGMPVRKELIENVMNKKNAIEQLNKKYDVNLESETPTLLIFGGSQGAQVFNEIIPNALTTIESKFQVIHLTGKNKKTETEKLYKTAKFAVLLLETSSEMNEIYSASDLVICRSGGSTIAELSIFAKFAILIPYPYASEKHQNNNADFYAQSNAGIIIENDDFNEDKAQYIVEEWLEMPNKFIKKGQLASEIAKPNATDNIVKKIEALSFV